MRIASMDSQKDSPWLHFSKCSKGLLSSRVYRKRGTLHHDFCTVVFCNFMSPCSLSSTDASAKKVMEQLPKVEVHNQNPVVT